MIPLLYFTHAELKSTENIDASFEIVKSKPEISSITSIGKSKSSKKIKLTIKDEHMSYEALEEDQSPFLVGVLDKTSRQLSVCSTKFFKLKPEIFYDSVNAGKGAIQDKSSVVSTHAEKQDALFSAFGSKRKQKSMQVKLKNKLDTETLDNAVNAAVNESRNNQTLSSTETPLVPKSLENYSIMPVPKKDAIEARAVYDLNEVLSVSKDELDRYTADLTTKFATASKQDIIKWQEYNTYSGYVCDNLLKTAGLTNGHHYKLEKCKLLAYMTFLISLYRLKAIQIRNKTALATSEVPDAAINKLFDLYTVSSNSQAKSVRSMPSRLKDKLMSHLLILGLFIDDFNSNLHHFQKDLKIAMQRLVNFAQALGCHVKSQSMVDADKKKTVGKVAILSLPLFELIQREPKKRSRV